MIHKQRQLYVEDDEASTQMQHQLYVKTTEGTSEQIQLHLYDKANDDDLESYRMKLDRGKGTSYWIIWVGYGFSMLLIHDEKNSRSSSPR